MAILHFTKITIYRIFHYTLSLDLEDNVDMNSHLTSLIIIPLNLNHFFSLFSVPLALFFSYTNDQYSNLPKAIHVIKIFIDVLRKTILFYFYFIFIELKLYTILSMLS